MPNSFRSFSDSLINAGNFVMRLVRGCSMQTWQKRATASITKRQSRAVILNRQDMSDLKLHNCPNIETITRFTTKTK